MIKTLLKGLAEIDAYLRNTTLSEDSKLHRWDPDIISEPDPWRTRAYWAVRVYSKRVWDFPLDAYRHAEAFIQRGYRGWADRDAWSLDDYLDSFMPDALRRLKETKHGIPMDMFDGLPDKDGDGRSYHSPETMAIAEARWDAIIDKMIAAFEASRRISDSMYEPELGPYPLDRPADVSLPEWKAKHDSFMDASAKLVERDLKIFDEGMALFGKHYRSLWD